MIRRQPLRKKSQAGVAIAFFEITEHLIVGAILFEDEDHMMHARAKQSHLLAVGSMIRGLDPMIIPGHLPSERAEFRRRRQRQREKTSLAALQDILVCGTARLIGAEFQGCGVAAVHRRRPGGADAVGNVECLPVAAHAHRGRVPAGGDQPEEAAAGRPLVVLFRGRFLCRRDTGAERDDRDVVGAAAGDKQQPLVWRNREAVRIAALPAFRIGEDSGGRGHRNCFEDAGRIRVHDSDAVVAVKCDEEARGGAIENDSRWLAGERDVSRDFQAVSQAELDKFAVALA